MVKLLLDFVQGKSPVDVKEILAKKPYAVRVKGHEEDPKEKRRYCFSYHQIDSDFHNLLVWECRGTILECEIVAHQGFCEFVWRPVAVPFRKFFNADESYNRHIPGGFDWSTAEIFKKEDGSLIKLYHYEGEWRWATNNGICAKGAALSNDVKMTSKYATFHDLIDEVVHKIPFETLNKEYTYLFELVSPYNMIVVNTYGEIDLILLAVRCNVSFEEQHGLTIEGVKSPPTFKLEGDLALLKRHVAYHPGAELEGFVVRDARGYRLKIKNPEYVMMHHARSSANDTPAEFLALMAIVKGEVDEMVAVRPSLREAVDKIKPMFDRYYNTMLDNEERLLDQFSSKKRGPFSLNSLSKEQRKQFAIAVGRLPSSSLIFALFSGKLKDDQGKTCLTMEEFIRGQTSIEAIKKLYSNIMEFENGGSKKKAGGKKKK